jgi:hypothetical protein
MRGKRQHHVGRRRNLASWEETLALASELSHVKGSSLIWCGNCHQVLVPVVFSDGGNTDVISLACLNCMQAYSVVVGVLAGPVESGGCHAAAR